MENVQQQTEHARTLERAERYDEACDVYVRLAAEEGDHHADPAFWLRLAELLSRGGASEQVLAHYTRAIQLFEKAGLLNNAVALCHRALRLFPADAATLLSLGRLTARLGYPRDAREALDGYVAQMEKGGEGPAALDELRAILTRSPGETLVRDAIQRHGGGAAAAAPPPPRESPGAELPILPGLDDPGADLGLDTHPAEEDDLPSLGGADAFASGADLGLEPTSLDRHSPSGRGGYARLEGLEPTDGASGWDSPASPTPPPDEEPEEFPLLGHSDDAPDREEIGRHRVEADREDEVDELDEVQEEEPSTQEEDDLPLLEVPPEEPEPSSLAVDQLAGFDDLELTVTAAGETAPEDRTARGEGDGDYVDLGALVLSDDEEDDTRVPTAPTPPADEDRDFDEILALFREKINNEIDPGDATSHYDLGLAFKEMGLLDDAIAQLHVALKGGANPLATLEVLGECFVEKGEPAVAERVLLRATGLRGAAEADLVGVRYWLGRCDEALDRAEEARANYERVVAVDGTFRDAAERLKRLRS